MVDKKRYRYFNIWNVMLWLETAQGEGESLEGIFKRPDGQFLTLTCKYEYGEDNFNITGEDGDLGTFANKGAVWGKLLTV